MANKKEPVAWITVKGVRVPIFEGQSKEDAFKSFKERIGKRNSNQPTTQAEKKRVLKEYTNARNAAHNAKPDKQEKAGERFEKAKQKYSESKEKTAIKSATFTAPSDRDPANKTNDEFMRRENERYERERGKGTYQKEETQKQQRIEQAQKTSRDNKEKFDAEHKALTRHEKIEAEWREHARRSEEGIKTKYTSPNHSKLDQHSEIQKMADEHVKKIWSREDGVANKELYDEADKFAEKYGLDKRKVREAAFRAMNEKDLEASRLNKAGKDPLQAVKEREQARAPKQTETWKQINKDLDEKEKQIARNEAEKKQAEDNDKRLGSYKVSELRMSDDEYEKYVSDRLVKNGWKKEMADKEAKQSVIDRAEDKSYFIKTGQLSLQDAWGTNKSSGSGQYDKYKTGYKYENAKTVNVNGNEYKVWSDDTYRGTFAEDKNGKVLPIKQSGYLSKEVSQRKAIANTFGESSFRSNAVKETTKSQKYQGSLSKMNTNQLRDLAVELGADRKKLYGTSKNALISVISNLKK